jgi:hypothetical protein
VAITVEVRYHHGRRAIAHKQAGNVDAKLLCTSLRQGWGCGSDAHHASKRVYPEEKAGFPIGIGPLGPYSSATDLQGHCDVPTPLCKGHGQVDKCPGPLNDLRPELIPHQGVGKLIQQPDHQRFWQDLAWQPHLIVA